MEGEKKSKGFPVKVTSKNLKHGDRIICISKDKDNLYLQKGKIVFRKKEGRNKYTFIAQFDNNVRSKDKVSHLCDAKMGFGAFVKAAEVRKIKKEKFSMENYQKFLAKLEKKEKAEGAKSEPAIDEDPATHKDLPKKTKEKPRDKSKAKVKKNKSKAVIKTERSIDKSPDRTPKKKKPKSKTPKRKKKTSLDLDEEVDVPAPQPQVDSVPDIQPPIQEPQVVQDDPNTVKIGQLEHTKMLMKIQELETKAGGYEMTLGVLKKEKQALEHNNKGLKQIIDDLKQKAQDQEGEVGITRIVQVYPL